jgi:hypothetical protein
MMPPTAKSWKLRSMRNPALTPHEIVNDHRTALMQIAI